MYLATTHVLDFLLRSRRDPNSERPYHGAEYFLRILGVQAYMYVLCPFTGTMAKLLTQTLLVLPTVAFFVPMMCLAFYWGHAHPVKKLQSYLELITRPITRLLGPLFHYISSCFFFLMSCCACGRHWTRRYRRRKLRAKREKESRRKVLSPQDLESGLIFEEDLEKMF